MAKDMYSLYALIKDKKPIYVGVTVDVSKRKRQHYLKGKEFDRVVVIKSYSTRKEALIAENSIIRFNGMFNIGLENSKFFNDEYFNIFDLNGGLD